jgi:hypothetical protein
LSVFFAAYFTPKHIKEAMWSVRLLLIKQQHWLTSKTQPSYPLYSREPVFSEPEAMPSPHL